MFDTNDEYTAATQEAMVNTYNTKSSSKILLLLWNFFLFSTVIVIGYFSFNYLQNETTLFKQTSVMGISYTKSDSEYLQILDGMSVDSVEEEENTDIGSAMDSIINESMLRDNSLYTQALSKEIDGKFHQNSRIILVKEGDTLASLSEKYYGNSMGFEKIIQANHKLNKESKVIYVGQKLNVPY